MEAVDSLLEVKAEDSINVSGQDDDDDTNRKEENEGEFEVHYDMELETDTDGSTPWKICDGCGQLFSSIKVLNEHMRQTHLREATDSIKCAYCDKTYKSKSSLDSHVQEVHLGMNHKCDICSRICHSAGKLWKHKTVVHGLTDLPLPANVKHFKCEFCEKTVLRGLEGHVRKNHPEQLKEFLATLHQKKLENKPKRYRVRERYKKSQASVNRSKLRKQEQRQKLRELGPDAVKQGLVPKWLLGKTCDICGKSYSSGNIKAYYAHMKLHKRMEESLTEGNDGTADTKPQICEMCGGVFASTMGLKRHLNEAHGVGGKFSCLVADCGKRFLTQYKLVIHNRRVHFGDQYKCDLCSKLCLTPGKLWKHKREDHGMSDLPPPKSVTIYECYYCSKKLLRGLKTHVETEHPEHVKEFQEAEATKKSRLPKRFRTYKAVENRLVRDRLRKRAQRQKLREMGPEAVRLGLVPKWLLGKDCNICKKTISSNNFAEHMRNLHGLGTWPDTSPKKKKSTENLKLRKSFRKSLPSSKVKDSLDTENLLSEAIFSDADCGNEMDADFEMNSACSPPPSPVSNSGELKPDPSLSPMNCPHCPETFTEDKLRSHLDTTHPDQCWRCPECFKVVLTPSDLLLHYVSQHKKPRSKMNEFTAPASSSTSATKTAPPPPGNSPPIPELQRPSRRGHLCKRCPEVCDTLNDLYKHINEAHPENCYTCPVCKSVKYTLRAVQFHFGKSHRRNQSEEEKALLTAVVPYDMFPALCPICDGDMTIRNLREHLRSKHGVVEDKPFECSKCKKEFLRRNAFLTHMEEDHGHEVDMGEMITLAKEISCKNMESLQVRTCKINFINLFGQAREFIVMPILFSFSGPACKKKVTFESGSNPKKEKRKATKGIWDGGGEFSKED